MFYYTLVGYDLGDRSLGRSPGQCRVHPSLSLHSARHPDEIGRA